MDYSVGYKIQGREKSEVISNAQFLIIAEIWKDPKHRFDKLAVGNDLIQICDIKSIEKCSLPPTNIDLSRYPKLSEDRLRAGWIRAVKAALDVNPKLFSTGFSLGNLIKHYSIAPEEVGLPTGAW